MSLGGNGGGAALPSPASSGVRRPRLLDLFCGAGGAGMGYHRAGFDVVGVDINLQPNYPFEFWQDDAIRLLTVMDESWLYDGAFDAIHASPPCQAYSDLAYRNGNADDHPRLIEPVRELLQAIGLPYVIENVEGAPLLDPVTVCGTERGLVCDGYRLRRHRLFETNWPLVGRGCACTWKSAGKPDPAWASLLPVMDVSGGGPTHKPRTDGKGGRTYKGTADQVRRIMGMPWATKAECNEAVPPAYTELVGAQLLHHIQNKVAA